MPFDRDVLWGLQATNYSAMAALTFTTWDVLITTDDEIRQIWKRPWTHLKSLYLFLRYCSLTVQIVATTLTLLNTAGYSTSPSGCGAITGFQGFTSQVLQWGVQLLIIMRIQALYGGNAYLRRTLHGCFFMEIVAMTVVFSQNIGKIEYSANCTVIKVPIQIVGFFGPPIVFESVLFAMTMVKFSTALREGWGREPVISRFMKDGIWAFALPFVSLMVNTCCMSILESSLSTIAFAWAIAIPGFAGYRLILNMSHLLRTNEQEDSLTVAGTFATTLEDDECFSTYPISRLPR